MTRSNSQIRVRTFSSALPEGEKLLWQGAPSTWEIARRILHVRAVAVYFALLLGWRILSGFSDQKTISDIGLESLPLLLVGVSALVLLAFLSWLMARTTLYSITTHRLLMQIGVALPLTVNIPFSKIKSADVVRGKNGSGDIVLTVDGLHRLAYVHFWPHVRSWYVKNPQPAMRALLEVQEVAILFSKALHAAVGQPERLFVSPQTSSFIQPVAPQSAALATA